jgi:hypothetical protein
MLTRIAGALAPAALAAIVAVHLVFFALRTWHVLAFPYPLDYGEGPLLAQVNALRSGISLPRLYSNPGAPPYLVVNYPPVYLVAVGFLAPLIDIAAPGSDATLLAGRLATLLATLGSAFLLWRLATPSDDSHSTPMQRIVALIAALAFLALPIVREWGALMRVDLLGVCLGLWGLLLTRRLSRWAALPLALSLLVKPSLIAAPAAALFWLWFRHHRRALEVALITGAIGGAAAGALHLASGGWFWRHVVAANANPWSAALAEGFWQDQATILWPLWIGAACAAALLLARAAPDVSNRRRSTLPSGTTPAHGLLPVVYTCFGAYVAFGVGKVGAYANYFLEFYAGAIWLIAAAVAYLLAPDQSRNGQRLSSTRRSVSDEQMPEPEEQTPSFSSRISMLTSWFLAVNARTQPPAAYSWHPAFWFSVPGSSALLLLLAAALLRYYPLWSENYVKPYGLIEGDNPPRLAFGTYGVWRDLRREQEILATLRQVNAALVEDVQAAGAPVVTDIPGVAAQAGTQSRLQAFEHRQLYDAGLLDQRPLLRDMADGRVPLVVLDYLGNWLTPEMIALITHRYAQTGSRGTFDLYQPVDPGRRSDVALDIGAGIQVTGVFLSAPGGAMYAPGERIVLTLELRRHTADPGPCDADPCQVRVTLATSDSATIATWERPLIYGALRPADWGDATIQHMHPIDLPFELPPGTYRLAVALRSSVELFTPPQHIAQIEVGEQSGRLLGERGYFVPAPIFTFWMDAGGYEGPGDPLMPAVPFADGVLQCFLRACVRYAGGEITRLPLGELVFIGESGLRPVQPETGASRFFPETGHTLRGAFLAAWEATGGMAALGPPISATMQRGATRVQYTRYARLERPDGTDVVRLANLGEEYLRLPDISYRWR